MCRGLALIFLCLILPGLLVAEDCLEYSDHDGWVGGSPSEDNARRLAVAGDHIYLADEDGGLQIYELTQAGAPVWISEVETGHGAYDIVVRPPYAFVAGLTSGVAIVDVSDPAAPWVAAYAPSDGYAQGLDVKDGILAYSDSGNGGQLWFYDVNDPAFPSQLGIHLLSGAFDVELHGSIAYAITWPGGDIVTIDLSDPTNPWQIFLFNFPSIGRSLTVHEDLLYIAASAAGVHVYDVSLAYPDFLFTIDVPEFSYDVACLDDDLFVATLNAGIARYDIANSDAIHYLGNAIVPGSAAGVAAIPGFAYVACSGAGVQGVRFGDQGGVLPLAELPLDGEHQDIAVSGSHAFLASGLEGMLVVDLSDPENPELVTDLGSGQNNFRAVEVIDDLLYLLLNVEGQWISRLFIYDVSDPAFPAPQGSLTFDGHARALLVDGPYAYVANGQEGLRIIDVHDPHSPFAVSLIDVAGEAQSIELLDDFAYLGRYPNGVIVVDVSDPDQPVFAGSISDTHDTRGLDIHEGRLYIADGFYDLLMADLSNPAQPVILASAELPGNCMDVFVTDGVVYAACAWSGVQVLEAADLSVLGGVHLAGEALAVHATESLLLSAQNEAGLGVTAPQCPLATSAPNLPARARVRLDVHPNPFNPKVSIDFDLPRETEVELTVHDVKGRIVTSLFAGTMRAGAHTLVWDGRDATGHAAAAGVYLIRFAAEGRHGAEKAVLLK